MFRSRWRMGFVLTIVSTFPAIAASLAGTVVDPTTAPIRQAQITLNLQKGSAAPISAITDAAGKFTITELASAKYDLIVLAPGFLQWRQRGLEIGASDVQLPPITLQIGNGGCAEPLHRPFFRRILAEIKYLFVPVDWSKIQICE